MTLTIQTKSSRSTQSQSRLLSIPREIRDQIYSHVLLSSAIWIRPVGTDEANKIRDSNSTSKIYLHADPCNLLDPSHTFRSRVSTILDTSLLQTNHQINAEASKILYEQNQIYVSLYHGSKAPLLGTPRLSKIFQKSRHLSISTYNLNFLEPYLSTLTTRCDIKSLEIGVRAVYMLRWIAGEADKGMVRRYLRPFAEIKVNGKGGRRAFRWNLFNHECMVPEMQRFDELEGLDTKIHFAGSFGKVRHLQLE